MECAKESWDQGCAESYSKSQTQESKFHGGSLVAEHFHSTCKILGLKPCITNEITHQTSKRTVSGTGKIYILSWKGCYGALYSVYSISTWECWGCDSVVELLPSIGRVLSSIPRTATPKKYGSCLSHCCAENMPWLRQLLWEKNLTGGLLTIHYHYGG